MRCIPFSFSTSSTTLLNPTTGGPPGPCPHLQLSTRNAFSIFCTGVLVICEPCGVRFIRWVAAHQKDKRIVCIIFPRIPKANRSTEERLPYLSFLLLLEPLLNVASSSAATNEIAAVVEIVVQQIDDVVGIRPGAFFLFQAAFYVPSHCCIEFIFDKIQPTNRYLNLATSVAFGLVGVHNDLRSIHFGLPLAYSLSVGIRTDLPNVRMGLLGVRNGSRGIRKVISTSGKAQSEND